MNKALQQSLQNLGNQLYLICSRGGEITSQIQIETKPKQDEQYTVFEWLSIQEDALFIYVYEQKTQLIIVQQHISIQSIKNHPQCYEQFTLEMMLYLNGFNPQSTIHFTNFGSTISSFKILELEYVKEMAFRLIDRLYFPCNKIFFYIDFLINEHKDYNIVQINDKQYMIHRMEPSMKQQIFDMSIYNKYTYQIALRTIHQQNQFINTLKYSMQLVEDSGVSLTIKEQLYSHDIFKHEIYTSSLIMNIANQMNDDVVKIISLILSRSKEIEKRTEAIKKQKLKELPKIFQQTLYIYKQPKNCHFPQKQHNGQKCKVCQKLNSQKIRKSNYKCFSCAEYYGINVTLCTQQCFKQFHTNPSYFLTRKQRIKIKIENSNEI